IAPRMRCVAKVSNCTPCAASKRLSASVRPIMPTWMRSSISTFAGSLAIIWWARRRTRPLYCFSVEFRSSWPLAVYMVEPEIMRLRPCGTPLGRPGKVANRGVLLEARGGDPAQVVAGWLARVAGRIDPRPIAHDAPEEVVGARRQLGGDARRARRARRRREHQLGDGEARALGDQLHRRVGVGHARRPVLGEDDRARRVVAEERDA